MPTFKTAKAAINHWRSVLTGLIKTAELGGEGNDVQFEQAFANLAHSFLRDKAPSLQQYEVGFQLLERNQEGDKAVGVFGFKVGSQWLYGPVFFLSGDLKGHELLYMKDDDQFVPLKENWINEILQKKPNVLGKGVDRNIARLGITPPNLQAIQQSPTKFGAAINPSMLPATAAVAYWATSDPNAEPKYKGMIDLAGFLKKEGAVAVRALVTQLMAFPKTAEALESQFGGLKIIQDAIDHNKDNDLGGVLSEKHALAKWSLGDDPPHKFNPPTKENGGVRSDGFDAYKATDKYVRNKTKLTQYVKSSGSSCMPVKMPNKKKPTGVLEESAPKAASLQIVTLGSFDPTSNLSAKDREILLRDGVLFFDKRAEEETSTAYYTSTLKLTNPTETGIYDVLVKSGKFERCLVVFGPHSHKKRHEFSTVVRLDGEKNWINAHPSYLWVKQKNETNGDDYKSWLGGLSDASSLTKSRSAVYMLVGPGGQASCPFRVTDTLSDDGSIKIYDVHFKDYSRYDRPDYLPPISDDYTSCRYGPSGDYDERIQLTDKDGGLMRAGGQDLYVPKGFKLLTIKPDTDAKDEAALKSEGVLCCDPYESSGQSDSPPIVPGSSLDVQKALFDKTASLKVYHSGTELSINGERMSPMAGLIHLVRDVGLRVKQARAIIKEAEQKKVLRARIEKRGAQEWPLQQSAPSAPGFPEAPTTGDPMVPNSTAQMPLEQQLSVGGMEMGDPSMYSAMPPPDPQSANIAMQASQTGQKEVFDSAMIGSILKSVRDDTMIDRHLGDLMKGLDKLGRILFSFYWHGDKFQDRYGKQDMPELEDSLRNAFEQLGDVVLFLKQKTVQPFPEEMAHADLAEAAA